MFWGIPASCPLSLDKIYKSKKSAFTYQDYEKRVWKIIHIFVD